MILSTAAWAATAAILLTYALLSVRPSKRAERAFHIANAAGFIPLAWLNALAHTWPALVVNLGFGLPAVYAVLREISRRRKDKRLRRVIHQYLLDSGEFERIEREVTEEFNRQMFGTGTPKEMTGLGPVLTPDGYVPRSMFQAMNEHPGAFKIPDGT